MMSDEELAIQALIERWNRVTEGRAWTTRDKSSVAKVLRVVQILSPLTSSDSYSFVEGEMFYLCKVEATHTRLSEDQIYVLWDNAARLAQPNHSDEWWFTYG